MANTVVEGTDPQGCERYRALYEEIMSDVGKLAIVERSHLILKPEVPLFIFSVKLKGAPAPKTVGAVASTRAEKGKVYVSITDEVYAPGILKALWDRYGRDSVTQTDRFDITVDGADSSMEVDDLKVESSEQPVQEVVGALWRVMPEGIRNRRVIFNNDVLTVVATEEIKQPEFIAEAEKLHEDMIRGVARCTRF